MAANRRAAFEKNIKRLVDDCPDDHIDQMDRPTVDDNLDKLRRNFDKFETEHLGLIGDAKTVVETQAHDDKYTEVDEIATTLRRKLAKRDLDLKKRRRSCPSATTSKCRCTTTSGSEYQKPKCFWQY